MDDLCGASEQDRRRVAHESFWDHVTRVTNRAVQNWQKSLQASADPRARAAGLVVAQTDLRPVMFSQDGSPPPEPSKDTVTNNSLVLLALETNDPAIYAQALAQCHSMNWDMAPGPCQGLSFEHWARIDPDNAVPWIYMAVRAHRAGDEPGANAALATAAQAARLDGYSSVLVSAGLDALPSNMAPLDRAVAYSELLSAGGLPATPLGLVSLCRSASLDLATRWANCTAIASRLADQGSTLIEVGIASTLAQQLDLPAEQREKLDKETRAMKHTFVAANFNLGPDEAQGFSCQVVGDLTRRLDGMIAAHGNERLMLNRLAELQEPGVSP